MAEDNNRQWFEKEQAGRPVQKKKKKNKASHPHAVHNQPSPKTGNQAAVSSDQGKRGSGKPVAGKNVPGAAVPVPSSSVKPVSNKQAQPVARKKGKKRYHLKKRVKSGNDTVSQVNKASVSDITPPVKKKNSASHKNARKKALKMVPVVTAIAAAAILVLYFVIFHLYKYFAIKPEFSFISDGSIEHTIGARAIFVRDEIIVKATAEGDLVTQATEGSRVSKDQNIAMIVPQNMETVVTSLRNTQSQISEVQQELIRTGDAEGADSIYDNMDERIEPIIDMIRLDSMNGKMNDISSYSSSVSVLITQREAELSELVFDDERLRTLRSDEAGYESQLQRSASIVKAPSPGIISFRLDGNEERLNFDKFLNMPAEEVKEIISNSEGVITSDLSVKKNEGMARIASNEKQYIAVFLDPDKTAIEAFEVGTKHTINIGSEGISIGKCVVERQVVSGDEVLIVFSTTRYVENLLDLRSADIEIVITESTGLRVPISSLVKPDYDRGIAGLYYNNKGFVDEVSVIIVDYDREFAIIAPIGDSSIPNHQTVIITNPKSVKPGDKVD